MFNELRVIGRLEMHLPEGYSKVRLEMGGRYDLDIPTRCIPPHLRKMGSRFVVVSVGLGGWPAGMTADQVRASHSYQILEIGTDDRVGLFQKND